MVAIKLGLHLIIALSHYDIHLILRSDNTGVIHALEGGHPCNIQQNRVWQHITVLFHSYNVWITTSYLASQNNPAHFPS